jgi:hypothetical protein
MAMPVVLFYQLVACHTPTRNDTFAGPAGRQADLVGAPYVLHKEDLRRIAPMWLHYTRLVRNDTQVGRWCLLWHIKMWCFSAQSPLWAGLTTSETGMGQRFAMHPPTHQPHWGNTGSFT